MVHVNKTFAANVVEPRIHEHNKTDSRKVCNRKNRFKKIMILYYVCQPNVEKV